MKQRNQSTQLLEAERVVRMIRELEIRFSWEDPLRGLGHSGSWQSRTAVLYEFSAVGSPTAVVVKVGRGWTVDKAREVYADLAGLHKLFTTRPDLKVNVPQVLGWLDSPPAVCQVRVEGEDLGAAIGSRHRYRDADVEQAIRRSGQALGLFHTAELVADGERTAAAYEEIQRGLLKMARRLLIDPGMVMSAAAGGLQISRKYGDFYPHNILLADHGKLLILDQPSSYTLLPVHRDVAYFLDRLSTHVGRHDPGSPEEVRTVAAQLQDSFLDGYRRTGPTTLDSVRDETLISLYRSYKSLNAAFKRARQRRYSEILKNLRLTFEWRRATVKSP